MPGSSILVAFAVANEARPFQQRLPPRSNVEILLTGIGPTQARQTMLSRLGQSLPSLVVSAGFAGGLNPSLRAGDLVCDCSLAPQLEPICRRLGALPARFHSSPAVLVSVEAKGHARQTTGADAVEMESGVIRELCRERKLPCAVLRVISDPADQALPLDFNACLLPDGKPRWPALVSQCLLHPSTLASLFRLRHTARSAALRLALALLVLTEPSLLTS